MRYVLALLPAVVLAGCCSGQRANIAPAAASATVTETRTMGVSPEIKTALMVPPDVVECFVEGGAEIVRVGLGTLKCAINRLAPTVVPSSAPAKAAAAPEECRPVYASPAKACGR